MSMNSWYLRTGSHQLYGANIGRAHRLAGPRSSHPDISFPHCRTCGYPTSPVMRLDFSDPQLYASYIWDGIFVALACHNGCGLTQQTWWDYRNPFAPSLIDVSPAGTIISREPKDWEFEEVPLMLVPRISIRVGHIDTETRVGGKPAWLDGSSPEERQVSCIQCGGEMNMIVQWSDTNMEHVPRGIFSSEGSIMGNPDICFWFGCRNCRIVSSIWDLD